ncbi:MAG: peptidoglycan-binding protein [Methylomonas sp.]|nr:MAG: peptidoglycan-binding protein [Methylomonas sp.]PPD26118.1 MAG: peptidoglycan-binding protein [Methylomonas sp.]PPD37834.1 MAG: peptidoglycan-binding protein [Methylomonas sp.]PPD40257.1 MAG: peptidoglycan-binding protein [Methylomonas sp.]PPD55349.1 MAG: peptidoglycan-binding protein [Methylomonas sp.]
MSLLKEGMSGTEVKRLQEALKREGFDPGIIDGDFGAGTEAAVIAFQKSAGLSPDGIVGRQTQAALGLISTDLHDGFQLADVTTAIVSKMFPLTPIGNIKANLPLVLAAMQTAGLADKPMILMALATIRAETAGFEPISEGKSRFNTSPNGHPFDLYDNRKDLGNQGKPDGNSFKGRGFVQLTGRANYEKFGAQIGQDLVENPALANNPQIAAELLALFLKSNESRIRRRLSEHDLAGARKVVNGGHHGLKEFKSAFNTGNGLLD